MKYKFDELIIDSRTGLNPRKNFVLGKGDNNYITIKDIRDGKIVISDKTDKVDDEAIQIIKKRSRIKNGDILFSSIGRVGDTAIVTNKDDSWDVNESVFIFTINRDLITPEYFCYLMSSKSIQDELNKNSTGSTFKSVKMGQLQKMVYDVPTLEEQVLISNQLKKTRLILQNKKQQLQEYDQIIKSRFVEMFGQDLKGKSIRLGDLTEVITKGTTPTTLGFDFVDEGVNFVKVECITEQGKFIKEKMLHINEECNEKLKRSILSKDDILFSIAGAIGRTAIVTDDILPANTNQALSIIRLNKDAGLNVAFLSQVLKTDLITEQIGKRVNGVAQMNVSLADISNLKIIRPTIDRQNDFAQFVQQVDKLKFAVQQSLNETQTLFDSLMQKYFG